MVGLAKKVQHAVPRDAVQRLKPHKLGRNYHKVPAFIRDMCARHPRVLSDYFLRHYRIGMTLAKVQVHESVNLAEDPSSLQREPECFYRTAAGKVAFAVDRRFIGEILECYYGGTLVGNPAENSATNSAGNSASHSSKNSSVADAAENTSLPERQADASSDAVSDAAALNQDALNQDALNQDALNQDTLNQAAGVKSTGVKNSGLTALSAALDLPLTHSEVRMRARIGADVAQLFARILMGGHRLGGLEDYDATYDQIEWEYAVEFVFTSHLTHSQSSFFIYLDTDLVDELTARITHPVAAPELGSPIESIKALPVQLDCVIAECTMSLAQVLALKLNDIVMVRLNERCDVAINQQKVFRGAVFEDNGALFLTSLESVTRS